MKAYLAWPVKFKNEMQSHEEAHITLKYIGTVACGPGADSLADEIADTIAGLPTTFAYDKLGWVYEQFNPVTHVMCLMGVDKRMYELKELVNDLRKEDYPRWQPHITLNQFTCRLIAADAYLPEQLIESIGPLTLYVDKKPYRTY